MMNAPISVRLDREVREILEAEAKSRGIGLATYRRQLASDAAHAARQERIRTESAVVARHIANNPEARSFAEDWGGGP
jgi:hypothetical protein